MFEVIGILAVWLFGAWLVFLAPLWTSEWWANTGDGLGDAFVGFWAGVALLAVYVIATVVYFVAT
jgi:hypothetical protein